MNTKIDIIKEHIEEEIFVKGKSFTCGVEMDYYDVYPLKWYNEVFTIHIGFQCSAIGAFLIFDEVKIAEVTKESLSINSWSEYKLLSHLLIEELLTQYENSYKEEIKEDLQNTLKNIIRNFEYLQNQLSVEIPYKFVMPYHIREILNQYEIIEPHLKIVLDEYLK